MRVPGPPNQTCVAYRDPAVSVIVPAYNAAAFIAAALESVLDQEFIDYEVIVVNDGSPDTKELEMVLERYRDRITYLKQENRGVSAARNLGLRAARGQYIAFLDADDYWLPSYLAEQLGFLEIGQYDLVYSDAWLFGNPSVEGKTFMQVSPSRGPVTFSSLITWNCLIITSCTVSRRQPLADISFFDESLTRCEDYDLWLRLAERGYRIGYQQKTLAHHRQHSSSLANNKIAMLQQRMKVLRKWANSGSAPPDIAALAERQIRRCRARIDLFACKRHLAAGRYEQSLSALGSARRDLKSWKLAAAAFGIRLLPRLVRQLYLRKSAELA